MCFLGSGDKRDGGRTFPEEESVIQPLTAAAIISKVIHSLQRPPGQSSSQLYMPKTHQQATMQFKSIILIIAAACSSTISALPFPNDAARLVPRQGLNNLGLQNLGIPGNGQWTPNLNDPNTPILWEVDSIAVMPDGRVVGGTNNMRKARRGLF